MRQFPVGWICTKLGELCELKNGYAFRSQEYKRTGIPVIRISDINSESVLVKDAIKINENDVFDNYKINNGDILIAMSGATTGKFGIYKGKEKAYQNQRVGKFQITLKKILADKYLYFLLFTIKNTIEKNAYGGAQPNISSKDIHEIEILVPPFSEQQRIVTKIEELFSELDNGIESLKAAQQQLKVYRQAVLKWAFEGKLTEEWRKKQNRLLTVDELHEVIKKERETKQKELCKKPKEDRAIQEDEMATLPELPSSWTWLKLCSFADIVGGITKGRDFRDKKTIKLPYLRVANVQDGYLDLREIKEIELLEEEKKKYMLEVNDILYTEGGDKDKLGRGTIWNDEISECVHQNHIFRARLYGIAISPKYIAYYSQTKIAKDYFYKKAKQTVNLASINMTVLSNLPVAIPSPEEQGQVVQEIESRLSVCDKMEEALEQSLEKAEAFRQSILKKAFEGKLVPQDPNDEPAEKLLERIRTEKAAQKPETKTTKRRAKK